ncbi:MAG: MaoC family dehydratase N-terminal domain-containing protein [Thermodesulfobacteriota bacterium]|nr:MaoC family dehydratase N-terminal domain-containing protein [Thermodesulfobacteriota bacterium]
MVDKSIIGTEGPAYQVTVEKGRIRDFVDAIGDPNPIYRDEKEAIMQGYDGIIAPPTFPTTLGKPDFGEPVFNVLAAANLDLSRILHGGMEYEYFKLIKPGDKLVCKAKITDAYDKAGKAGTMEFYVSDLTICDQKGEKVVVGRSTVIMMPKKG